MLVEVKSQRHISRALDAVDADLAVSLRGVGISCRKERAVIQHRQIQPGTRAQLAYVHIAAKDARRAGAKFAIFCRRHSHHSAERGAAARRQGRANRLLCLRASSERGMVRQSVPSESRDRESRSTSPSLCARLPAHLSRACRRARRPGLRSARSARGSSRDQSRETASTVDSGSHLSAARVDALHVDDVA